MDKKEKQKQELEKELSLFEQRQDEPFGLNEKQELITDEDQLLYYYDDQGNIVFKD